MLQEALRHSSAYSDVSDKVFSGCLARRLSEKSPSCWVRNANGDPVKFFHFPGAVGQKERRQRWIRLCHRGDSFVCTKDSSRWKWSDRSMVSLLFEHFATTSFKN